MVHIDEACPHCRVRFLTELRCKDAQSGFDCPECGRGLLYTQTMGARLVALGGFGLGSMGMLLVLIINACLLAGLGYIGVMGAALPAGFDVLPAFVMRVSFWLFVCLGSVTLELIMLRMFWKSGYNVLRGLAGQRLFPAKRRADGWYKFDYNPTVVNFRRGIEHDESVDGALSLSDSFEDDTKGAISTTSDV